jgi:hypothetical protein
MATRRKSQHLRRFPLQFPAGAMKWPHLAALFAPHAEDAAGSARGPAPLRLKPGRQPNA